MIITALHFALCTLSLSLPLPLSLHFVFVFVFVFVIMSSLTMERTGFHGCGKNKKRRSFAERKRIKGMKAIGPLPGDSQKYHQGKVIATSKERDERDARNVLAAMIEGARLREVLKKKKAELARANAELKGAEGSAATEFATARGVGL